MTTATMLNPHSAPITRTRCLMNLAQLRRLVVRYYADTNRRGYVGDVNHKFVNRLVVNYLRHKWTEYDRLLQSFDDVASKTVVRNRVLTYIASQYPQLSDECERQKRVPLKW